MSRDMSLREASVAVVVPTYNREKELIRAVRSVQQQTRQPDEVVIVDDNSEREVERTLRTHCPGPYKVIRNATNLGAAQSRNIGVRATTTQLVAFLDSDDIWMPEKLQKQLVVLSNTPDASMVYCDVWIETRHGKRVPSRKTLFDTSLWGHLIDGWNPPNTSTLLLRRGFLDHIGGFDSGLRSCQDHDLWMRLARARARVGVVRERLAVFSRTAHDRISLRYSARLEGMERFVSKWREPIIASHGTENFRRFRADYEAKVVAPLLRNALAEGQSAMAWRLLRRYLLLNRFFYGRAVGLAGRMFAGRL